MRSELPEGKPMLFEVVFWEINIGQTIGFWLFCRKPCRAENPVPPGKFGGKVGVSVPHFIGMVPAVHLWSVDDVLEKAGFHIDVGVNPHSPDSVDRSFENGDFRRGTQQDDRCEFDGLVDDDFERMTAHTGNPVNGLGRMVSFVNTPQNRTRMHPE